MQKQAACARARDRHARSRSFCDRVRHSSLSEITNSAPLASHRHLLLVGSDVQIVWERYAIKRAEAAAGVPGELYLASAERSSTSLGRVLAAIVHWRVLSAPAHFPVLTGLLTASSCSHI